MIRLVEAIHYRSLKYISIPLNRFHVLVGPNASGKTTFLDVIGFLSDLVKEGLDIAITKRSQNFFELLWQHKGDSFSFAIELSIPEDKQKKINSQFQIVRYEIELGIDNKSQEILIHGERVLFKNPIPRKQVQRELFPMEPSEPSTLFYPRKPKIERIIINKKKGGNDNFYSEIYSQKGKGWAPSFKLGPRKSALGNLPADESKFPVTVWLKDFLTQGVQSIILNSLFIRNPSPPKYTKGFKPDGSNLPWVIHDLSENHPEQFQSWLKHVQTALPDILDIKTIEKPEDKHRYLKIHYNNNLNVPSWMVSDGTLRFLALTLPAYLSKLDGVYLIEEPENGIHPKAIEAVYQSLSSVYDAQILLATHSPVILSACNIEDVLCLCKTKTGATDIVLGNNHPNLRNWKGEENLGVLFAGGVLG